MTHPIKEVQEHFLNFLKESGAHTTIFLVNGVKLQGIISAYDQCSITLRRDGHSQLVYKHSISTVMPVAPISMEDRNVGVGK